MTRIRRFIVRALIMGMAIVGVLAGGALPTARAQSPVPPCVGTGCNASIGRAAMDPSATTTTSGGFSCARPPSTYSVIPVFTASAPVDGDNGIIVAELRYSTWCQAYWARGFYVYANQAPTWSLDIQVTQNNAARTTVEHRLTGSSIGTDGFTNMYSGPAEACSEFGWVRGSQGFNYRICTHQIRLEYIGAASYNTVGTNCAAPSSSPVPNIWRFRVVGLSPGTNRVRRLDDGPPGGIWQNITYYPCVSPFRWPLVDRQFIINSTFGGVYFDVAAWPPTNSPGTPPVSGRLYTAEVLTAGTIIRLTYNR